MRRWLGLVVVFASLLHVLAASAGSHQIGGGVHYWQAVENIDTDDIDKNGLSYLASYRYNPATLFALQLEFEVFPKGFMGLRDDVYSPQGMIVLGSVLYAGLGVGTYYYDGDFADDPFYILRAGVDLEVLPRVHVDVNGNYQFTDFASLKDIEDNVDTDTITLGAAIRIEL